jgi:hypothetical protein
MARNAARLKMGYYPLPESEAVRLRALLSFTGPASVVDPCTGTRNGARHHHTGRGCAPLWRRTRCRAGGHCPVEGHRDYPGQCLRRRRQAGVLFAALSESALRLRDWTGSEQPHGAAVSRSHLSLARNGWRAGDGHSLRAADGLCRPAEFTLHCAQCLPHDRRGIGALPADRRTRRAFERTRLGH